MSMFLFVPGAWLGGWCWRDVAGDLRAAGHTAIAPTLTGLGERAHLLTPDVGLHTHVADISGILRHRDPTRVILVGHSYGGPLSLRSPSRCLTVSVVWCTWMRPCRATAHPPMTLSDRG